MAIRLELTLEITPGEYSRADHYRILHRGKPLVEFYGVHNEGDAKMTIRELARKALTAAADFQSEMAANLGDDR
jgi:hypothetical protein